MSEKKLSLLCVNNASESKIMLTPMRVNHLRQTEFCLFSDHFEKVTCSDVKFQNNKSSIFFIFFLFHLQTTKLFHNTIICHHRHNLICVLIGLSDLSLVVVRIGLQINIIFSIK